MWFFFSFSFFQRTRWTNIGCFMLSDPELETSECTPTHPPTAHWQNTARIRSTGLTINPPPGTGDTFTYNNFMWSNCPWSQMIQNIRGWIEFLMYYEIWRIFSPFLFLYVFVLFASVFTHTQLTLGALKLNEHHNGLQRKVVAIGAESKSTAFPSSVERRCDLLHDRLVHRMTV